MNDVGSSRVVEAVGVRSTIVEYGGSRCARNGCADLLVHVGDHFDERVGCLSFRVVPGM
jgi:hypothetical protein